MSTQWAAVWRPSVLGKEWIDAYGYRGKRKDPVVLLRVPADRPHPRVVLPLAVLTWGCGQAMTPALAATLVAGRTLEETVALLPERLALPVPCLSAGRCPATIVAGRLVPGQSQDREEDVARALLHRGACSAAQQEPPRVDLLSQWMRMPFQPLVLSALQVASRLQASTDLVAASRRVAGWVRDEESLVGRWSGVRPEPEYGFARWKSRNSSLGTTSCGTCRRVLRLPGTRCPGCSGYPNGPTEQDTVLDRLDVALGVYGRGE